MSPSASVASVSLVASMLLLAHCVRPLAGARQSPGVMLAPASSAARPNRAGPNRLQLLDQSIDLLDDIGRSVRSGVSLTSATTTALRAHLMLLPTMLTALDAGATLVDAARSARAVDIPIGEGGLIAQTLYACASVGGPVGDALDRAGGALRERRAFLLERTAQSAQARLSAVVMTFVPLAFAAWGAMTSGRIRHQYSHSGLAAGLAVIGLALNLVGWRWMRATINGPDR